MSIEVQNSFRLSVSKVKTYLDCPKKYMYTYILKLPRKDHEFHALGRCIHSILEFFHTEFINGSTQLAHQVMGASYKKAMIEFENKLQPVSKTEIRSMLDKYLKRLASEKSKIELKTVKSVEKNFNITLANNIVLNGMIDRVQYDPDGIFHLCDYKTTKNKKYLKDDFLQLLTYAYAIYNENPEIKKVRGSYILLRHDFEYLTKEFELAEIIDIKKRYEDYAKLIQEDTIHEAKPSKLCLYCDAYALCDEGKAFIQPSFSFAGTQSLNKIGETKW